MAELGDSLSLSLFRNPFRMPRSRGQKPENAGRPAIHQVVRMRTFKTSRVILVKGCGRWPRCAAIVWQESTLEKQNVLWKLPRRHKTPRISAFSNSFLWFAIAILRMVRWGRWTFSVGCLRVSYFFFFIDLQYYFERNDKKWLSIHFIWVIVFEKCEIFFFYKFSFTTWNNFYAPYTWNTWPSFFLFSIIPSAPSWTLCAYKIVNWKTFLDFCFFSSHLFHCF